MTIMPSPRCLLPQAMPRCLPSQVKLREMTIMDLQKKISEGAAPARTLALPLPRTRTRTLTSISTPTPTPSFNPYPSSPKARRASDSSRTSTRRCARTATSTRRA